jgi:uncharacterized membrane protein
MRGWTRPIGHPITIELLITSEGFEQYMKTTSALPILDKSQTLGRIFIAISLIVFGIQHFLYGGFVSTLVPAWMPARLFWAYFVGVAFVSAALGTVISRVTRLAGTLLGVMFFLFVATLHIPRIAAQSRNGDEWTSGFVALAMCGIAWILANSNANAATTPPLGRLGRYFFAFTIVVFGFWHFVYARLATGISPPWIPGRPLWAWLIGVVFVAAGAAIIFGRNVPWAAALLAATLFLYSALVYMPRIVARLHNPGPWTSSFEILAMCGGALILAGTLPKDK